MKILLGYDIKSEDKGAELGAELTLRGYEVEYFLPPDRYPNIAARVCLRIGKGQLPYAVLLCQTGIGMTIVANKFPEVRAVNGTSPRMVRQSRERNNCNVLCLGAKYFSTEMKADLVETFLSTEYAGESDENLKLIARLERGLGYV